MAGNEFVKKVLQKIEEERKKDEEVLRKIMEVVHYYYNIGEALTPHKLAKEVGLTEYKLAKYLARLEEEEQIKVLKYGRARIILPNFS